MRPAAGWAGRPCRAGTEAAARSSQTAAGARDEMRVAQRKSKDSKGLRTEPLVPTVRDQGQRVNQGDQVSTRSTRMWRAQVETGVSRGKEGHLCPMRLTDGVSAGQSADHWSWRHRGPR